MAITTLLLDFGNTLAYEHPSRAAIYGRAGRERGLAVSDETMAECMARAHRDLPRVHLGHYRYSDGWFEAFIEHIFHGLLELPADQLRDLTADLFERFEDPGNFRLFPGVEQLFATVQRLRLTVGVVSNWSARLPRLLEELDLARRLDFVVCSAIERAEKPEQKIFELALERAEARAQEAVLAGDHPIKDGAASQLGIEVVLVDHFGQNAGAGLPRVGDLTQLAEWLEERCA